MHGTGGAPRQSRGTTSDMLRERTTVEQLDGCAGVHNGQEDEVAHARHVQRREHVDYDKMVDGIQRKVAATMQRQLRGAQQGKKYKRAGA